MPGETQITLPSVEVAERSDPGRDPTKQVNEDACGHRETPFGVLAVVCDGMGGHVGGREASNAAVATIFESFEKAAPGSAPRDVLRDAIRRANARVRGLVLSEPEAGGGRPGSTVVAVLVHSEGTELAHVGDSRVYLVHQGQISQVTRDHSMVQEMVEAKILTPEQAATHPDANKITRALGIDDDVDVELRPRPVYHVAGDSFILCSDGLSDLVTPLDMLGIVSSDPPAQAVGRLVDLANARGGYDNVTVMIVRPRTSAPHPPATGTVAMTISEEQVVTLRPPKDGPMAVIPVPPIPPIPPIPAPPAIPGRPARRAGPLVAVLIVIGMIVVVAGVVLEVTMRDRTEKRPVAPADVDAAPTVTLGSPASSVNLAPADLPPPAEVDAAGVTPLEPAPSLPAVRHLRGKGK
jgi:protein phosphatase